MKRIVISGTVGVGKSTISKELKKELEKKGKKVLLLDEKAATSVFLKYYYNDPSEWAFIAQMSFLIDRFEDFLKAEENKENYNYIIYDRHFIDDYIFAELHSIKDSITNFSSITYQVVYKTLQEKIEKLNAKPDYLFLLKLPLDEVLERLKKRNRKEELNIPFSYWEDLYNSYYYKKSSLNHFKELNKKIILIDKHYGIIDLIMEELENE